MPAQAGHEECVYDATFVDGQFADMECQHGYSASGPFMVASAALTKAEKLWKALDDLLEVVMLGRGGSFPPDMANAINAAHRTLQETKP